MNRANRTLWHGMATGVALLTLSISNAQYLNASAVRTPHVMREDQVVNTTNRKAIRRLLRAIDSNASEGLPRAMASGILWLSEAAGPALEMVQELQIAPLAGSSGEGSSGPSRPATE